MTKVYEGNFIKKKERKMNVHLKIKKMYIFYIQKS